MGTNEMNNEDEWLIGKGMAEINLQGGTPKSAISLKGQRSH